MLRSIVPKPRVPKRASQAHVALLMVHDVAFLRVPADGTSNTRCLSCRQLKYAAFEVPAAQIRVVRAAAAAQIRGVRPAGSSNTRFTRFLQLQYAA